MWLKQHAARVIFELVEIAAFISAAVGRTSRNALNAGLGARDARVQPYKVIKDVRITAARIKLSFQVAQ